MFENVTESRDPKARRWQQGEEDSGVREQRRERGKQREERWKLKKERMCMRADKNEKETIIVVASRGKEREKEKEKVRKRNGHMGVKEK